MPDSFLTILSYATIHSFFSIILVGLTVHASLAKRGVVRMDDSSANILSVFGWGMMWGAVRFLVLFKLDMFRSPALLVPIQLGTDLGIVALLAATVRPMAEMRRIVREWANPWAVAATLAALTIGVWAFLQFPHTFDSGQLLWTQEVLWGRIGPADSMIGFSGLIAPVGTALPDIPLVTIAAGFKPLLLVIAVFVCVYVVRALELPHPLVSAALLALLMLVSVFGLYGVIELGKDSIYGVLFSVAFMATLCRPDVETRGVEAGLFFAVAAVLGIVTVPYMLIALALWLIFAATAAQFRTVALWLLIINAVTLPVAVAGMIRKPYWLLLLAYGVAALGALLALAAVRRFGSTLARLRKSISFLLPALPVLLMIACALLLPAEVKIMAWINADGSEVVEVRPPLDGETGFIKLMFFYPSQPAVIALGLAVMAVMAFVGRSLPPALIAVAAMPLATLVVILVHLHLGLRVLSPFNQWDLIKDVPLWYGGAMFSAIAVAGLGFAWRAWRPAGLGTGRGEATGYAVLAGIVAVSALIAARPGLPIARYATAPPYSTVGGSIDADMAVAAEQVWLNLRGRRIFIEPSLLPDYFYSFQMFGGYPSVYRRRTFEETLPDLKSIGLIVPTTELFSLERMARRHKAHLELMSTLPQSGAVLLSMDFDGSGRIVLPSLVDIIDTQSRTALVSDGAYGLETVGDRKFRWFRKDSRLDVNLANGVACVTLEAFGGEGDTTLSVETDGKAEPDILKIAGGTIPSPRAVSFTLRSPHDSLSVRLVASTPEIRFPNDSRPIAWGGNMPIQVKPGSSCADGASPN